MAPPALSTVSFVVVPFPISDEALEWLRVTRLVLAEGGFLGILKYRRIQIFNCHCSCIHINIEKLVKHNHDLTKTCSKHDILLFSMWDWNCTRCFIQVYFYTFWIASLILVHKCCYIKYENACKYSYKQITKYPSSSFVTRQTTKGVPFEYIKWDDVVQKSLKDTK